MRDLPEPGIPAMPSTSFWSVIFLAFENVLVVQQIVFFTLKAFMT
jgi:hypothetical protein